jgi:NTP pyrophosphatase (non-canonical NTP hydrolase)
MQFDNNFTIDKEKKYRQEKDILFRTIYELQKRFQLDECKEYTDIKELPIDNSEMFKYHALFLIEEIGEMIKTDKRWKHFRNQKYDRDKKLSELADCFICLMNVCLFSGYNAEEVQKAIIQKIFKNYRRMYAEKNAQN